MLALIRHSDAPLDDDQIAQAAQMNRVYVNVICRQLAEDKLIVRSRSGAGKLVNSATGSSDIGRHEDATREPPEEFRPWLGPRRRAAERLTERIRQLTADFAEYVAVFEASQAFPGPSLYFHLRAIERRRAHQAISSLLSRAVCPLSIVICSGQSCRSSGAFSLRAVVICVKSPTFAA